MDMNVKGKKEMRRPKKRWLYPIESDMRTAGVCIDDVERRVKWGFRT